jgi:hypothetical protein
LSNIVTQLGTPVGWTICWDRETGRTAYEASLLVCRHCGKCKFMCDGLTKKPLPAHAVAERCNVCNNDICGKCKLKMRSGEICSYFRDRIDMEEYNFARLLVRGSYG